MKLKEESMLHEELRYELRCWFSACIEKEVEPIQIYEMLLSESKICKDRALDCYERTSEIHDLLIGNLTAADFNP
jgi:hypothetical protein